MNNIGIQGRRTIETFFQVEKRLEKMEFNDYLMQEKKKKTLSYSLCQMFTLGSVNVDVFSVNSKKGTLLISQHVDEDFFLRKHLMIFQTMMINVSTFSSIWILF